MFLMKSTGFACTTMSITYACITMGLRPSRAKSFISLNENLLHLACALVEHFIDEIAPLKHHYINQIDKIKNTNLLF